MNNWWKIPQMIEQKQTPTRSPNPADLHNLPDEEFKITVILCLLKQEKQWMSTRRNTKRQRKPDPVANKTNGFKEHHI